MAVWFAPPPIQLPATVAKPLQISLSGLLASSIWVYGPMTNIANGPPMTIPRVPVRNMAIASSQEAGFEIDTQG